MIAYQRILFPVAFSDRCRMAARHVANFARLFHSQVTLLHVVEAPAAPIELGWPVPTEAPTEEELRLFAGEAFGDLPVNVAIAEGDPAVHIARFTRDEGIDLIMMPTHGRGPFRRFLLGSVTAKVLHDVRCPVWTSAHVEDIPEPEPGPMRDLLCGIDLDESSIQTLRYAHTLATHIGARLTIAHAVEIAAAVSEEYADPDLPRQIAEAARKRIRDMQDIVGSTAVVCVETGDVAHAIRKIAISHRAELVIIGRGNRGVSRFRVHGYGIIRECPSPVLSI